MKAAILAAVVGLVCADLAAAAPAPFGSLARPALANPEVQPVRYVRHRRHYVRRHHRHHMRYRVRRAGPRYVVAPGYARPRYAVVPGYAGPPPYVPAGRFYPGADYSDRGDPLHRYYTPGLAPNVGNPSYSPSYQNPAVDDGVMFPNSRR